MLRRRPLSAVAGASLRPWEVDPDQPRLQAGMIGRLRHYRNLNKTEARLRMLLKDFRFGPLCNVLSLPSAQAEMSHVGRPLPYLW